MKIAVIGSRSLTVVDLAQYLPIGVTEIVSGGARGVDTSARVCPCAWIVLRGIPARLCEIWAQCAAQAQLILLNMPIWYSRFGTEESRGTAYVIRKCRK